MISERLWSADPALAASRFPPTRYQGSKRKLTPWLGERFSRLEFATALDAFGGTGCVSYLLKAMSKRVTFNDMLAANAEMARGLIENDRVTLTDRQTVRLLRGNGENASGDGDGDGDGEDDTRGFIRETFAGIYFLDEENAWLDRVCPRIHRMKNRYARSLAWYALFQAALAKRPYNLFHRRNLYMRTAQVARSFGNKRTWDRSFADHFAVFAKQANAAVMPGASPCRVTCADAAHVEGSFDLAYLDPPYVNQRGIGVDYADFYHFLEGLIGYDTWAERIDFRSRHRRLLRRASPWTNQREIHGAFAELFARHADSILVVSYRGDGIPSIDELAKLLRRFKRRVEIHEYARYQYALSTNRRSTEVLLVGS